MNILSFLIPKEQAKYVINTDTLRNALEKMDEYGFQAIPIININGEYIDTISEGDLLRYIKNSCDINIKKAEDILVGSLEIKRHIKAVNIYASTEELFDLALNQNFVPIVDDLNHFIGIVTRKAIINYFVGNKR
jgi:CBS domain-containing protein